MHIIPWNIKKRARGFKGICIKYVSMLLLISIGSLFLLDKLKTKSIISVNERVSEPSAKLEPVVEKSHPCPKFAYPLDLEQVITDVRITSTDFSAQDCLEQAGELQVGFPFSTEWTAITIDGLFNVTDSEYYFLRCLTPRGTNDTVKLFPELKFPIEKKSKREDNPNIVVLLFDSVSREKFRRSFPKTIAYLERYLAAKDTKHVGTIFSEMHVVGHNSYPNKLAIYSGTVEGIDPLSKDFLWPIAAEKGYIVSHLDGECGNVTDTKTEKMYEFYPYGSITGTFARNFGKEFDFNYAFPGSLYCAQLQREITISCDIDNEDKDLYTDTANGSNHLCIGARPAYEVQFEFIETIFKNHPNEKHFMTATFLDYHQTRWNLVSMDDALLKFISNGLTKYPNTAYVLMSDHGIHYGPEFEMDIGRVHARLPLFYPIVPKSVPKRLRDQMLGNKDVLLSQHDVYETLRHLIDPKEYKKTSESKGVSMLSGPIPTRSCYEMGIPPHFCLCYF